jgi:hypothetical protein
VIGTGMVGIGTCVTKGDLLGPAGNRFLAPELVMQGEPSTPGLLRSQSGS